ncbi:hypothetical protein SNEBB_007045 [Seison nebaliae]|nr:hypothetical protein SNEBB_007045 [Seison nebaliae]
MGGHWKFPDIPDYKTFRVNGIPELEQHVQKLSVRGLKDPWIRNEAWRFDPKLGYVKSRTNLIRGVTLGMPLGFAIALLCYGLKRQYVKTYYGDQTHH